MVGTGRSHFFYDDFGFWFCILDFVLCYDWVRGDWGSGGTGTRITTRHGEREEEEEEEEEERRKWWWKRRRRKKEQRWWRMSGSD